MHSSQDILDTYITVHVTRTWKDTTFDFNTVEELKPIIATPHTWGDAPENYIKIERKWFFIRSKRLYHINSNLVFKHDFHFKSTFKTLSGTYKNKHANPPVEIIPKSQVHRYQNSRVCNHMDFHTDNNVSHFLAQDTQVIGVVYLPYEHNPSKRYPIAKISPDTVIQDIAPPLIAFCLGEDYGQLNSSGHHI
ncbi:hypothetical protein [Rubritalea sp.]|uniref:hypothetical protein n=1 Tax=Rubritalea sp. TaxID=2109375 RepID=UPI003EF1E570